MSYDAFYNEWVEHEEFERMVNEWVDQELIIELVLLALAEGDEEPAPEQEEE